MGYSVHWGCSVHQGDILSTLGIFSTSDGYHDSCGGSHDLCGGYDGYIRECSEHQRGIRSILGDIMNHVGGYHEYTGKYREYIRGISQVHRGNIMST